jgi:hypothetical protein
MRNAICPKIPIVPPIPQLNTKPKGLPALFLVGSARPDHLIRTSRPGAKPSPINPGRPAARSPPPAPRTLRVHVGNSHSRPTPGRPPSHQNAELALQLAQSREYRPPSRVHHLRTTAHRSPPAVPFPSLSRICDNFRSAEPPRPPAHPRPLGHRGATCLRVPRHSSQAETPSECRDTTPFHAQCTSDEAVPNSGPRSITS